MNGEHSSYRRTLWATSLVGGATLASVVIGLARNKAVALIGGPAAVGLLGLFTSIVSMGASITTFGLDTSAVRQLSRALNGSDAAPKRRAIWTMAWPLAFLGAALTWALSDPLARFAAVGRAHAGDVPWLGIGVAASLIAATQMAILQGSGRVADMARVRLWGSVLATTTAVIAVYAYGISGIVLAVLSVPLANALFAFWLGRRLPAAEWTQLFKVRVADEWRVLASIGAVVTVSRVFSSLSELWTRALVTHRLGLDSTGFYHASWSITWVNLSLILNAMAADYFPRVSKVADDPRSMSEILNQQIHVALLLAGPVLMMISLLSPFVLNALYSHAFASSALLLRLLLAAGVLRLPMWALGYILLARKAAGSFLLGEVAAASIIPLTWILLPVAGLSGAGIAAVIAGLLSFLIYLIPVHLSHGVRLNIGNAKGIAMLVALLIATAAIFEFSFVAGIVVGASAALVLSWRSYRQLRWMITPPPLGTD